MVEIKLSSPPLGYAEYNPSVSVYAGPQTVGTAAGNIFQLDVFHAPAFIGITFIVGAGGTLTEFNISAAARTGGTYIPWLSGSNLGTPSTLNPLTIASGGTFAIPVPASSSFLVVLDTRAFESLIINATGGTATTLDFETSYYTVLPVNQ